MSTFDRIAPGVVAAASRVQLPPKEPRMGFEGPYLMSPALAEAVNVALHLDRPLLVTGEPGTGKTALAWGVAAQLGCDEVFEYRVRSTSSAQSLLYEIDHLRRLHDANRGTHETLPYQTYLRWGPLGRAIRSSRTEVVLVDEIDKAPRDFPNDLLNELDRMTFWVPELKRAFHAQARHAVIVTSNGERPLPAAFLRRCVHHHLAFPAADTLAELVRLHTGDLALAEGLIERAVERLCALREISGLAAPPATDALLAWVRVLAALGVQADDLAAGAPADALPALGVLLKTPADRARVAGRPLR